MAMRKVLSQVWQRNTWADNHSIGTTITLLRSSAAATLAMPIPRWHRAGCHLPATGDYSALCSSAAAPRECPLVAAVDPTSGLLITVGLTTYTELPAGSSFKHGLFWSVPELAQSEAPRPRARP